MKAIPPLSSRWSLPALALVAGSIGVGGAWGKRAISELIGHPITHVRSLNEGGGLDSRPLCCMDQRMPLRVRNDSRWRAAVIARIESSCGCATVADWPGRIAAGEAAEIGLGVSPGPFEDRVSVTLTLVGDSGQTQSIPVAAEVVPLFAGWPKQADGTRIDARVELRLDRRYLDAVREVLMFSRANERIGVVFDRERGLVLANWAEWEPGQPEIVIVFRSGRRWAGPFVVRSADPGVEKGSS